MPKASIEYMNARRALMPASGGTNYARRQRVEYAPANELELEEQTEQAIETAWMNHRIHTEAMWQQLFERFGVLPAEHVDEIPF